MRTKLRRYEMEELQARVELFFYEEFIINGVAGKSIPGTNELSEKYNVSLAVVRNFYKLLQKQGVIRTERRKGTFLQAPDRYRFQHHRREVLIGVIGYIDEEQPTGPLGPCAQMFEFLERAAVEHGWRARFFNIYPKRNIDDKILLEIAKTNVNAIWVTTSDFHEQDAALLKQLEVPVLVADHRIDGVTCVSFDDFQIGLLATNHLLDIGHRKLAFIEPAKKYEWAQIRKKGFCQAFKQHKINLKNAIFHTLDALDPLAPIKVLGKIEQEGVTAMFCANDYVAITMLDAGLDTKKVAIIGADDHIESRRRDLSTIQKIPGMLGVLTFKTLRKYFEDGEALPPVVFHKGMLIKRGSTFNAYL